MTIKEMLYDLVSIQSDTNSAKEKVISEHILQLIQKNQYFKEHPELCGEYDGNDPLGRKIIWALRKGKTSKTVIIGGHYDAVEIDSYGSLKELALKPAKLKTALKDFDLSNDARKDLQSDNWHFGRGMADMKAGLAISLHTVFSEINEDVNVLFFAVHDEETYAKGMCQSVGLLLKLREMHKLDYKVLVNTEPHLRSSADRFVMYDGSVGKLLPCVVAKGWRSHAGNIMSGLNPSRMMAGVINRIELNLDLCSQEFGVTTMPPTVLYTKDSKDHYDVTIPDYYASYLNVLFFKNACPYELLKKIKDLCAEAAGEAVTAYDDAYIKMYGSKIGKRNYDARVYTFAELEEVCRKTDTDFDCKIAIVVEKFSRKVKAGELDLQEAGIEIVKSSMELSKIQEPMIVVGLLPPFCPPTNNQYLPEYDSQNVEDSIRSVVKKHNLELEKSAYFMGISDNSYTSCTDKVSAKKVMANVVTPYDLYDIDFDQIHDLSVPSIIIGPWGKDYHTVEERVYMPDVEEVVPEIIASIIKNI